MSAVDGEKVGRSQDKAEDAKPQTLFALSLSYLQYITIVSSPYLHSLFTMEIALY